MGFMGDRFLFLKPLFIMGLFNPILSMELKLTIQNTKVMASSPITSWQIDGETMEIVTDFIFLGSKITADSDYSLKLRHLLLGRKAVKNLDSILKSRGIIFPT